MLPFLARRLRSFRFAFEGIKYVFRTQRNAQIHLLIVIIVLLLAAWLEIPLPNLALIILTIGLVLGAEFLNTALEAVVDLASPRQHHLAKIAKDVGAGGVLLLAIIAVIVGVILLGPPLLERVRILFG
jgi:diacylglycerol kinase